MAAAADNNRITLTFRWKGPNRLAGGWEKGGWDIKILHLLFKDVSDSVHVSLPYGISPDTEHSFPFTCLDIGTVTTKQTDRLQVTAHQIQSLTIKAEIFTKGPSIGATIYDPPIGRVFQRETALRSDRKIPLEIPSELEPGKTYQLQVESKEGDLLATLIKQDESESTESATRAPAEDADFLRNRTTLVEFLEKELGHIMIYKVRQAARYSAYQVPKGPLLVKQAFQNEFEKIERSKLEALMKRVLPISKEIPFSRESLLYRESVVGLILHVVGSERLTEILRSFFEAYVEGDLSQSEIEALSKETAERYLELYASVAF